MSGQLRFQPVIQLVQLLVSWVTCGASWSLHGESLQSAEDEEEDLLFFLMV